MGIQGVWVAVPITDGIAFVLSIVMMAIEYRRIGKNNNNNI